MITDFSRFERWLKSKQIKKWTANLIDSSVDIDFIIHDFVQKLSVDVHRASPAYGFSDSRYNYFLVFDIAKKTLIIFGQSLHVPSLKIKSECPVKFVDKK
jgi:hypothetical protein